MVAFLWGFMETLSEKMRKLGAKTQFKKGAKQAEIARKGGKASQKVQHENKTMQEELKEMLNMVVKGSDGLEMTTRRAILAKAIAQAMEGDDKARTFVRDTSGQKPVDKVENDTTIKGLEVALVEFV